MARRTLWLGIVLLLGLCCVPAPQAAEPERLVEVTRRVMPRLSQEVEAAGLRVGAPIFLRIFKLPGVLELWLEHQGRYRLFRSYPICAASGYLGPKLREGDWQSPEGLYSVGQAQMNPTSAYHLSFDLGFPNEYDLAHLRSGSALMVHGNCASVGCYAMTDSRIEEIYLLAQAALNAGQERFAVHIFPFPLSDDNLRCYGVSPWAPFWRGLKPAYEHFAATSTVPAAIVTDSQYCVTDQAGADSPRPDALPAASRRAAHESTSADQSAL
ncbi:MAG: hypothetical protein BWK76_25865 [Desulfobulbaceae bacterium A2]|nr:MAG: hypothetical protein BWK76_25865 [Desulfobulbaceae bacterium A2]